jgi:hypothetical protein
MAGVSGNTGRVDESDSGVSGDEQAGRGEVPDSLCQGDRSDDRSPEESVHEGTVNVMNAAKLEELFKDILQKDVRILLKDRVLREGKFILFRQTNFCFELILMTGKKMNKFLLPIPYSIEHCSGDSVFFLDYRNRTLVKDSQYVLDYLKKVKIRNPSKYYNSIIEVETT